MKPKPSQPIRSPITLAGVNSFLEDLAASNPMLAAEIKNQHFCHGPGYYAVEYSFKQLASHVTPFTQYVAREARGGGNRTATGYVTIGFYPTRQIASRIAWMLDRDMKELCIPAGQKRLVRKNGPSKSKTKPKQSRTRVLGKVKKSPCQLKRDASIARPRSG